MKRVTIVNFMKELVIIVLALADGTPQEANWYLTPKP
jgi:hypothetical protein